MIWMKKKMTNNNPEIIGIFSVPIFHIICENWKSKKEKLNELMKSYEFKSSANVMTTYCENNNYGLNGKLNKDIENIFSEELKIYQSNFSFPYFSVENSWFQIEKTGMNHNIHNHGIGVSGICYLDYNENYHKPVNFVSPHVDVFDGSLEIVSLRDIKEGSLILFPSMISHFTHRNTSEHERKIVSFNINILPR
jgi:hypothetical protein